MINQFIGENAFLSNFSQVKIIHLGYEFNSVECAYAASKCKYPEDIVKFVNVNSGKAKRLGRTISIREDWENVKLSIMEDLLRQKFNKSPYKEKLIATGDQDIFEGNTWGDKFWGVDLNTFEGKNNLGKLIMKIRENIKNDY